MINSNLLFVDKSSISKSNNITTEHSIFINTLGYISESNSVITEIMTDIINESYLAEDSKGIFNNKFSFEKIIKKLFELFKNIITKIWKLFKGEVAKIFGNDATIEKYSGRLRNYLNITKKHVIYDGIYYRYTYIDANIPPYKINEFFDNDYSDLFESLKVVKNLKSKNEVLNELEKIKDSINKENYKYDIQQMIVGDKVGSVTLDNEDFASLLFKIYRDGTGYQYDKETPINYLELLSILDRNINTKYSDLIKKYEKENASISDECNKTINQIKKLSPENIILNYVPDDQDIRYALNNICKSKIEQMQYACNAISQAYAIKIEAVKESILQDRKILLSAIAQMIKDEDNYKED